MASDRIIDVTEADFEYEVLAYSQNIPVVVDFWATWCRPCKTLSPLLEKLAHEAVGSFRLAKVDVDANPNLALQYGIRTVPTVKAFSMTQVVGEFVGLQPEERIRSFVMNISPPSKDSLAIEKGNSLLSAHQWDQAEEVFRELLEQNPENPDVLLGLAKSLLGLGDAFEALLIIRNFPASKQYARAEILLPFAESLGYLQQGNLRQESDMEIAFANCIKLASKGNIPASLDGLLEILRQNKHYRNGLAHKVILSLFEMLGQDDAMTGEYRMELASILF
jgi:putative thioredoxin